MKIKKLIKPIILFTGALILLVTVFVVGYLLIRTQIEGYSKIEYLWKLFGYVFAIIGSMAAAMTVVVALFKEDLLRYFHSPDLSVEKYSQSIIPIVKVDGKGAGDSYYKCELKINNNGTDNARNCTIVMSRLLYDTSRMRGESKSEWDVRQIERVKDIGEKSNQIVSGLDTRVELFRINNPLLASTPNGGGDNRAYIIFPQTSLSNEIAAESNFEIDYEIRAENSSPIKFRLSIEWTGKWNDSISEMSNNVKVKIA